jgi:hypothetical protein
MGDAPEAPKTQRQAEPDRLTNDADTRGMSDGCGSALQSTALGMMLGAAAPPAPPGGHVRAGPSMNASMIAHLQRSAGNASVAALMAAGGPARGDTVQRQDTPPDVPVKTVSLSAQLVSVPLEAGLKLKASAQPTNATDVTFSLEKGTVAPSNVAIDGKTGTITTSGTQQGGSIMVKATAKDGSWATSALRMVEKPNGIASTTTSASGSDYGGDFTHTFTAPSGQSSGLEGANINESFDSTSAAMPWGGTFTLSANVAGSHGWDLDAAGAMTGADTVTITKDSVKLGPFVKSASNPKPKSLPQSFTMTQKLKAKSFPSNQLGTTAFTTVAHKRTLTAAHKVVVEAKESIESDYDGPPAYSNASATPATVSASVPKPKDGTWTREKVQVKADVIPSSASKVFSITGAALGCEVDASGEVLIGEKTGSIKVRVSDGTAAHYDEVTITITARKPPPAPEKKTATEGDSAPSLGAPTVEGAGAGGANARGGERAIQRTGAGPCSCAGACACPRTEDTDDVVQRKPATLTVQRAYSSKEVEELLTTTPQADVPGKLIPSPEWLGKITPDERKKLIQACLGSDGLLAGEAIAKLWQRDASWEASARADPGLWRRSLQAMIKTDFFTVVLQDKFLQDVEQVARGYLDLNKTYCESTLESMGLDKAGKPTGTPPTAAQAETRKQVAPPEVTANLVELQKGLAATRQLVVKRFFDVRKAPPAGGPCLNCWTDVTFDPKNRVEHPPSVDPKPPQTWDEVKKAYDAGVLAIQDIISLYPALYVLVRDQFEDVSKTTAVADDKSPDRSKGAEVIGTELAKTLANIATVRPMITAKMAKDLTPIHEQLRAGAVTSPGKARNWATDPVWKPLADTYVEANKPRVWWQALGLAALEMGVIVVAGLATGGVGFAAAMAIKGAGEAAMAYGKSQIYGAAAGSNVTAETAIMTPEQAREAEFEAQLAIAFALLDALQVRTAVKGLGAAAKAGAAEEARKAIDLSQKVMDFEKKLLGTVSPEDAAKFAADADRHAADALKHAGAARAAANAAQGAERAGLEARAKLAEKAAERASKGRDRLKNAAAAYGKAAEAAAKAVPEQDLGKVIEELVADGGGKIVVTKNGQVFHCASPCTDPLGKYAAEIARHPELAAKVKMYEAAYQDAQKAVAGGASTAAEAAKRRAARAGAMLAKECENFRKAAKIMGWLRSAGETYPILKKVALDESAVARILAKGPGLDKVKGQLFEEITAAKVRSMLATTAGKAQLGGKFAGEALEFIPGHLVRDAEGRQLTDGLIGFWTKEGRFQIVTVIEAKAGVWASEGLRLGEAEVGALRSAKHRQMIQHYKSGNKAAAADLRNMSVQQFADAHPNLVKDAMEKRLKADGDWEKQAIETIQEQMADELRAAGKAKDAAKVEALSTSQFKAAHPEREQQWKDLMPLPEAGQFTRDLERKGQIGLQRLDPEKLPPMVIQGPKGGPVLNPQWKGKVPQGEWSKLDAVGNRGSVRSQGFVPSDADPEALTKSLGQEGLAGQVDAAEISGRDLDKLAGDIVSQAKAAK